MTTPRASKGRRWTVTTAETGPDDFGAQVYKRGKFYYVRAWDHRHGYGPVMATEARRTLRAACAVAERWLSQQAQPRRKR